MVIGPSTDPEWAEQQDYALGLLFSPNIGFKSSCFLYLTVVISAPCSAKRLQLLDDTSQNKSGTTKSDKSLTVHLATRLSALTTYQENWVRSPSQMPWLLLVWHQLCFQDVDIAHPSLCGYAGVAPQTIIQAVHTDLGQNLHIGGRGPSWKSSGRVFESIYSLILTLILDRTQSSSSRTSALPSSTTSPHCKTTPKWPTEIDSIRQSLQRAFSSAKCRPTKVLGTYGRIGGASKADRETIMHNLVRDWTAESRFIDMLYQWNPAIDPASIRPFITGSTHPNIVSVIHFIAQSINKLKINLWSRKWFHLGNWIRDYIFIRYTLSFHFEIWYDIGSWAKFIWLDLNAINDSRNWGDGGVARWSISRAL